MNNNNNNNNNNDDKTQKGSSSPLCTFNAFSSTKSPEYRRQCRWSPTRVKTDSETAILGHTAQRQTTEGKHAQKWPKRKSWQPSQKNITKKYTAPRRSAPPRDLLQQINRRALALHQVQLSTDQSRLSFPFIDRAATHHLGAFGNSRQFACPISTPTTER
jgi:hypothetical protein